MIATRSQSCSRFVHVVRGEQNRAAVALELPDQVPELAPRLRIEAGGRLVEKEQTRDRRRARRPARAAASARRRARRPARARFSSSCTRANRLVGRRAMPEEAAEQLERFEDGELVGQLRLLQLNAEPLAQLAASDSQRRPSTSTTPESAVGQAFADFDGRGLAGAVRAEQAETLAGGARRGRGRRRQRRPCRPCGGRARGALAGPTGQASREYWPASVACPLSGTSCRGAPPAERQPAARRLSRATGTLDRASD